MEDLERYGDYNDIDDDAPRKPSIALIAIKAITAIVILSVVGILAFRMILFNSYPKSVSNIYFNDTLTAYYNETDGNIGAKTQKLRAPYDDENVANFICDKLIVIEGAEQLQITVRYNSANVVDMAEKLGLTEGLDDMDPSIFSFRLAVNYGDTVAVDGKEQLLLEYCDSVSCVAFEKQIMYRYQKLVFDGVKLAPDENGRKPEWIRLEVFVRGQSSAEPFAMVAIYEDHEDFNTFSEYKLSEEEMP